MFLKISFSKMEFSFWFLGFQVKRKGIFFSDKYHIYENEVFENIFFGHNHHHLEFISTKKKQTTNQDCLFFVFCFNFEICHHHDDGQQTVAIIILNFRLQETCQNKSVETCLVVVVVVKPKCYLYDFHF